MTKAALTPEVEREWIARVTVERARTAPPADFPALPDIPGARYTDADFFELERKHLWQSVWLYAGHLDQLPDAGSYFVWAHGSSPIVVMRGDDGEVRAFYNTCRHRGAPVVRDEEGRIGPVMACGYHGWTYDRQGCLRGLTDQRDWRVEVKQCRDLIPVRCGVYGNFIFVCEEANTESLEDFLAPIARYFEHLPLKSLRLVNRRAVAVRAHVKVMIENFLEAYHFKLLHPGTTDRIFDNLGTSIHLWRNGHSMMLSPNRREDWIDPGTIGMPEMTNYTSIEKHHNPSYHLFPNLILPIAPSGIPCVAFWPKTQRTSVLEVLWFAPDWGGGPRDPLWDKRIANFDRIADEDIQFAEPMQETIESPGFTGVPLNYQERRIYHWHEELDRRIGAHRIAPALRIAPKLEKLVE